MIAAAHPDRVAAVGGFHAGRMVTDAEESAHLLAPRVRAEICWGHADQDPSMTPENIQALDQAMDDAGVPHTTERYEGAQHGTRCPTRPPTTKRPPNAISRRCSRCFNEQFRAENIADATRARVR